MQFELTKEFIQQIKRGVEERRDSYIKGNLEDLYAADISSILYNLDTEEARYVINILDREISAEIISDLDEEVRQKFLRHFTPYEIAQFIDFAETDDAADILNEQEFKTREEVISHLSNKKKASDIVELLRYEEDCAGGLMAKEMIKANLNWTVVQCIDEIRRQKEKVDKIYSIYVTDDKENLLGRISTKKLLLARDNALVADLYEGDMITVQPFTSEVEVAGLMRKYDFEALPVVNIQGKLIGRITIDDVVDVIQEMAEQDRQLMSGLSDKLDTNASIWQISRARLPWLLIGMIGGLFGAQLIGFFEGQLIQVPAMAFFIPLITATGGNVGIQSSSIVVQGMADKTFIMSERGKRIQKSMLVAILNGIAIALLVYIFNIIFTGNMDLSFVVSIALFSVVLLSSLMGTITPIVLDKFGINPAVASGPFITTTNDLLGLAVYFMVAHLLIN